VQVTETHSGVSQQAPAITRQTTYSYDRVKRMTREIVTGAGQNRMSQWNYDAGGNRVSEISGGTLSKNIRYLYDLNDRLTKETDSSGNTLIDYSYDQNGNNLQKRVGTNTLATYRWDQENRMTGATIGNTIIAYAYDPQGIRRSQEENNGTARKRTEYLIDANRDHAQVLEEWAATTSSANAFPPMALSLSYVYGDDLISQTKGNLTSSYHYDGLGTTRMLTNASGAVTDRYSYNAFGEADPGDSTPAVTPNKYLFAGEQLDSMLGLYYLRARYMDAANGRFIGADPYKGNDTSPTTLHRYLYAQNSPAMFIDPSGRFGCNVGSQANLNGGMGTQSFGYMVEYEVEKQYCGAFGTHDVDFGAHQEFGEFLESGISGDVGFVSAGYFKPDIFDHTAKTFNEIKPLSVSGISSGIAKLKLYAAIFSRGVYSGADKYSPNIFWTPNIAVVNQTNVWFVNVEGLLFYSDLDNDKRAAFVGVALSSLAWTYKSQSGKSKSGKKTDPFHPVHTKVSALTYANVGIAALILSTYIARPGLARF